MTFPLAETFKNWTMSVRQNRVTSLLEHPRAVYVGLVLVLLIAAWFRLDGLAWDEGRHLHPDERFLSTVANDLRLPENFETYFDPSKSTLSPYTLPNMGLYIYGTLPVYLVKPIAVLLNRNNYDAITLLGRVISGLFDLGGIFFLFLIGRRLYGSKVGLLAAGLLAFSVLNIQLSHFYTVDTFANLFIVATFYFLLRALASGRWVDYALMGLMFGLGLASKLSVMSLAAPILVGMGLDFFHRLRLQEPKAALEHTLVRLLTVVVVASFTFRIIQPIAFEGPGFWNWSLNPRWLRDIVDQENLVSGNADLPWVEQWTDRSVFFPLYNIVVWGMGLPLGLASMAGFALAGFELVRRHKVHHLLPLVYVSVTFLYHATTFVKFMRYFLPIYPFLALFAAYFLVWYVRRALADEQPLLPVKSTAGRATTNPWLSLRNRLRVNPRLAIGIAGIVIVGTFLYALAFSHIYAEPNPRINASRWIYQNISAGSVLANEHWDDWLPIGGVDEKQAYGDKGLFRSVEMANYEDDTPAKLETLVENLTRADYIILSSNRLYDSIPRLPLRYPMTIRYYQLLFEDKLGFERVAEFSSYPNLFGIPLPDQAAEESFSVYDHPRVQIFKKTPAFDAARVRQQLGNGIVWSSVIRVTPKQATAAPDALLFSADEQALYAQAAAETGQAIDSGWGSQVPVLAWLFVIELLGLAALPLTLLTFRRLVDRGYLFTKAIGLLLTAWGAWMLASLRLAPFNTTVILAVLGLLVLISGLIAWRNWTELKTFLKIRWRLVLFEEALFILLFGLFLAIRWSNPDLWHPVMGGEKPMDLAYLTAISRTPFFPSYDPWFAGGYINYYYFGFVLVAAVVHLTGMATYIAYNLAIPTFFAMTALGSFSVALNFAEGRRRGQPLPKKTWLGVGRAVLITGLCGALFVAILGNLGQVQLLWDGMRNLSAIKPQAGASPLINLVQFADGALQWLGGRHLGFNTEWWYWNATRIIPKPQTEAGPINEMPFFTFLYADLHAHLMALPYTLLVLALGLNLIRGAAPAALTEPLHAWWRDPDVMPTLGLLALTTGALLPINTWDFPTYLVLAGAALACREYARHGRINFSGVWNVTLQVLLLLVVGRLLFLPFYQNFASSYFGAAIWNGSHTPLWAYLLIHGFFIFVIGSYMVLELLKGHGHNSIVRALRLQLLHWRKRKRLNKLFGLVTAPRPSFRYAVIVSQVVCVLLVIGFLIQPVVGVSLGLGVLAALLVLSPRPHPRRQFLLCMVGLGMVLTAIVEFIVLDGDISRVNTVFKFYFQVWVLWAIASAAFLPQLAGWLKPAHSVVKSPAAQLPEGSPWTPEIQARLETSARRAVFLKKQLWWAAFVLLLGGCLLYPFTAAPIRVTDRFKESKANTLDGTAYMRTATYTDEGQTFALEWDRLAAEWLRQNVKGIPVIVEANTPLYRWGSRISIYTGLPSVVGWDWHQRQQRSVLPGKLVEQRIEDVRTIYTGTDVEQTKKLLDQYNVQYIYVGPLERIYYSGEGLNKFAQQQGGPWHQVYHNDQVQIYKLDDGGHKPK